MKAKIIVEFETACDDFQGNFRNVTEYQLKRMANEIMRQSRLIEEYGKVTDMAKGCGFVKIELRTIDEYKVMYK